MFGDIFGRRQQNTDAIFTAIRANDINAIAAAINNGGDINGTTHGGFKPLNYAAYIGKTTDIIDFLLDNGADIDAEDGDHYTPLHHAASRTNIALMAHLITKGARVDEADITKCIDLLRNYRNGITKEDAEALIQAIQNRDDIREDAFTTFLQAAIFGSDIESVDGNIDALFTAINDEDVEAVHYAVANLKAACQNNDAILAEALNTQKRYHKTALLKAISKKNIEIINILLDARADVNTKDSSGYTPLHSAAMFGTLEMVETLLAVDNINVNAVTTDKCTPISLAARKGHEDIVNALITAGADVNMADRDRSGRAITPYSPLYNAACYGHVGVMAALINGGASNVSAQNIKKYIELVLENGRAISEEDAQKLRQAAQNRADIADNAFDKISVLVVDQEIIDQLFNAININDVDAMNGAMDTLKAAYENDSARISNALNTLQFHYTLNTLKFHYTLNTLRCYYMPENKRYYYDTKHPLLHYAAIKGNTDAMRILLENGADINVKNHSGYTALEVIARSTKPYNRDIATFLLENGADINSSEYTNGTTILEIAARNNNTRVFDILKPHYIRHIQTDICRHALVALLTYAIRANINNVAALAASTFTAAVVADFALNNNCDKKHVYALQTLGYGFTTAAALCIATLVTKNKAMHITAALLPDVIKKISDYMEIRSAESKLDR